MTDREIRVEWKEKRMSSEKVYRENECTRREKVMRLFKLEREGRIKT